MAAIYSSHPSHILCLTCKSKKIFLRCLNLSCLDVPSNLGCKSFNISEALVEMIVVFDLEHSRTIFLHDTLASDQNDFSDDTLADNNASPH